MRIGGKYKIADVGVHQWRKLEGALGLGEGEVIARARELCSRIPDLVTAIRGEVSAAGLEASIVDRLAAEIVSRAQRCAGLLAA